MYDGVLRVRVVEGMEEGWWKEWRKRRQKTILIAAVQGLQAITQCHDSCELMVFEG